jgi:DNA-binding MarR family transcriptional regulator
LLATELKEVVFIDKRRHVIFTIKTLALQLRRLLDESASNIDKDMTGIQAGIIAYIDRSRGRKEIFQKDIEEEFNIRRSTATGILNTLEKKDMIKREPVSYDKRLKKLILTEKAHSLCQKIYDLLETDEERLISNLTEEEIDIFLKIIAKMMKNII